MRGIILSGGTGSRLWPITKSVSKQLLPVYDKPLIYYPLATLMELGIRQVLIITTALDLSSYQRLLGDGSDFGVTIEFEVQDKPEGIAQAIILGQDFIGEEDFALILGDNLFHGITSKLFKIPDLRTFGTAIFGIKVANPSQYGVAELDSFGRIEGIFEKPSHSVSNLAIPGLYFFNNSAQDLVLKLEKSARGEFEITDLLKMYLEHGGVQLLQLGHEVTWFDCGTPKSLNEASNFVRAVEERRASKVACLEEIAFTQGWISSEELRARADALGENEYSKYLRVIAASDFSKK